MSAIRVGSLGLLLAVVLLLAGGLVVVPPAAGCPRCAVLTHPWQGCGETVQGGYICP